MPIDMPIDMPIGMPIDVHLRGQLNKRQFIKMMDNLLTIKLKTISIETSQLEG